MKKRLTDVLSAIEDAFDEDKAIELLRNHMEDERS